MPLLPYGVYYTASTERPLGATLMVVRVLLVVVLQFLHTSRLPEFVDGILQIEPCLLWLFVARPRGTKDVR